MGVATYGDMLENTRIRLDEITPHRWLDTPLIRKLYAGAKDVARKTECIRARATWSAVASQQEYTTIDGVPENIVRIHHLYYTPDGEQRNVPLDYRDFMSMDAVWWTQQTVAIQTPAMFTTWGTPPGITVVAYPTPPDTGLFTMLYYALPADPADDPDVQFELVGGWEDCAIDYAVYMALLEDHDTNWQTHKTLYEEHLSDLAITAQRFSDQAGMIVPDGGSGSVPRFIWDENY